MNDIKLLKSMEELLEESERALQILHSDHSYVFQMDRILTNDISVFKFNIEKLRRTIAAKELRFETHELAQALFLTTLKPPCVSKAYTLNNDNKIYLCYFDDNGTPHTIVSKYYNENS